MPKAKKTVKKERVVGATKPKLDYHLEVSYGDTVYKGDAVDLNQALKDFIGSSVFPHGAKTKVIVKISKLGSSERVRVLSPLLARRLFSSISLKPVALEILAGKLTSQLE